MKNILKESDHNVLKLLARRNRSIEELHLDKFDTNDGWYYYNFNTGYVCLICEQLILHFMNHGMAHLKEHKLLAFL